ERLVQISLYAHEQRIVCPRIEERLHPLELYERTQILRAAAVPQDHATPFSHLRSADAVQRQSRIEVLEQALLVPLQFDPRRVPHRQVEPAALGEYLGELELPMVRS